MVFVCVRESVCAECSTDQLQRSSVNAIYYVADVLKLVQTTGWPGRCTQGDTVIFLWHAV